MLDVVSRDAFRAVSAVYLGCVCLLVCRGVTTGRMDMSTPPLLPKDVRFNRSRLDRLN